MREEVTKTGEEVCNIRVEKAGKGCRINAECDDEARGCFNWMCCTLREEIKQ
jgi:hypothetical protein